MIEEPMLILDGKSLAKKKYLILKGKVEAFSKKYGRTPKLAVIIVGDDPASRVYVNNKHKACLNVGIKSLVITLEAKISHPQLLDKIKELNADDSVDGFLVQMPLPKAFKGFEPSDYIKPEKDVDGLSSFNMGCMVTGKAFHEPCTPEGVMELLQHYDIPIEGRDAVVVGRSKTVGWPMAYMLTRAGATVTVCHSKTLDLSSKTKSADIVVVAAGRPLMLSDKDFKAGAVIVDVGIHSNPHGKGLVGDVDFKSLENSKRIKAASPVPGGVGPMTVAQLITHTLNAAVSTEEGKTK